MCVGLLKLPTRDVRVVVGEAIHTAAKSVRNLGLSFHTPCADGETLDTGLFRKLRTETVDVDVEATGAESQCTADSGIVKMMN